MVGRIPTLKVVQFSMPEDVHHALKEEAGQQGCSLGGWMCHLLTQHVAEQQQAPSGQKEEVSRAHKG